jgi:hypothetical protein
MTKYDDIIEAVNLKIDELKSLFGPQLVEINKTLEENKLVFKATEERFAKIEKSIKINEGKLSALNDVIKKKDDIISQLGCSVTTLKDAYRYTINKLNYYEQRPRSYTAKFHNLATSSTLSNLDLQRFVWDTFCVPTFALAKKDGRIKSLRKFETSIDTGHFLGQGTSYANKLKDVPNTAEGVVPEESPADDSDNLSAAGRNFLLRFNNRNDKTVFMVYKKTIIEDYNKTNNSKVRVGEDLTANNRNLMNLLCSDKFPEVGKNVRIRNSNVQYALESDKKAWKTVHNVFATTLEEMSKQLSDPVEELFNVCAKKT